MLVLLVTDDPPTRADVGELLAAAGLDCCAPAGLPEARRMLVALRPEALLVDVHLRAVAELLPPLEAGDGDLPMVFVMGDQGSRPELGAALAEGAADVLIKPFSAATLRVRIGDAIRNGRTAAALAAARDQPFASAYRSPSASRITSSGSRGSRPASSRMRSSL